ncbi:MAG: putative metal chaperone YciC [bacterium ADurb.Bin425]|nr:MAG: putative metal chaperone YciC [bacterium ADurb.Bin425]
MTSEKIPVTLVTGFLGSGKTTLLNHLLSQQHGKRLAIIENEFGEIGIDDTLLIDANGSSGIFKMNNGCLCCTVKDDLVTTLTTLHERRAEFDQVIIETTGVANPVGVLKTFLLNEDLQEMFSVDAVVTLVDAAHILDHLDREECREQIACADLVIVNKIDLVSEGKVLEVEAAIKSMNPLAALVRQQRSAMPSNQIFGLNAFMSAPNLLGQSATESGEGSNCAHEGEQCGHNHDHGHDHDCGHGHDHGHINGHVHEHTHECDDKEGHCSHDHGHAHAHEHSHHHDIDLQSVSLQVEQPIDKVKFNTWFAALLFNQGDRLYRVKGILHFHGEEPLVVQAVHRVVETAGRTGSSQATAANEQKNKTSSRIVFIGKIGQAEKVEIETGFKACLQV